jgi:hypothetical protein
MHQLCRAHAVYVNVLHSSECVRNKHAALSQSVSRVLLGCDE